MIEVTFQAQQNKSTRQVRELLRKFGAQITSTRVFQDAFDEWALVHLDPEIQKNLAGEKLKRRTGNLASRTGIAKGKFTKSRLSIHVETRGIPYAMIQEHGGTIRPVRAKALTVPLPAALTPAGVLRQEAREYRDTFVFKSRAGNAIIAQKRGKQITPLFVLKDEVKIPASHWASDAVKETFPELATMLVEAFDDGVKGLL